jgi:plastocyanin
MMASPRHAFRKRYGGWNGLLLGCFLGGTVAASYAAPKAAVHTVAIEAMQFSPPKLEVNVGDMVIWKNKDAFPHTATSDDRGFDSGNIQSGRSWKFVAKKRGTFPYFCTLHPTMKAVLVVK